MHFQAFQFWQRSACVLSQVLCSMTLSGWVQAATPVVPMPEGAYAYSLGEQMNINGLPMRITGFNSKATVDQTIQWFKDKLGKPLVESQSGRQRILARAQEGYYITIQLLAGLEGPDRQPLTLGIIAVSDLALAVKNKDISRLQKTKWQQALPEGTSLLGVTSFDDADKTSFHIVATNAIAPALNAQFIARTMTEMGYRLEASSLHRKASTKSGSEMDPGETLLFKGPGKEAMAVISRDVKGQTAIVINTQMQLDKRP